MARYVAETRKTLFVTTPPNNVNRCDRRRVDREDFWRLIYQATEDYQASHERKGPTLVRLSVSPHDFKGIREHLKANGLHIQEELSDS